MISVLGPQSASPCRPKSVNHTACGRAAYYTVSATSEGITSGSNACPEYLFPTVGHFLGLPERGSTAEARIRVP